MTTDRPHEDGVGCGLVASALAAYLVFAVVMVVWGLNTTNFSLLFAGLPVSAFLTALGGEFILAWPVDTIAWIVLAFATAKYAEQRVANRWIIVVGVVLAIAAVYGVALGSLVEPSGAFFDR